MKKIVFVFVIVLVTSCASLNQTNKVVVKDYSEQMSLLKVNFPEIYEQYKNGQVDIDEIYTYTDKKTGHQRVNIKYHRPVSSANYYYRF